MEGFLAFVRGRSRRFASAAGLLVVAVAAASVLMSSGGGASLCSTSGTYGEICTHYRDLSKLLASHDCDVHPSTPACHHQDHREKTDIEAIFNELDRIEPGGDRTGYRYPADRDIAAAMQRLEVDVSNHSSGELHPRAARLALQDARQALGDLNRAVVSADSGKGAPAQAEPSDIDHPKAE